MEKIENPKLPGSRLSKKKSSAAMPKNRRLRPRGRREERGYDSLDNNTLRPGDEQEQRLGTSVVSIQSQDQKGMLLRNDEKAKLHEKFIFVHDI